MLEELRLSTLLVSYSGPFLLIVYQSMAAISPPSNQMDSAEKVEGSKILEEDVIPQISSVASTLKVIPERHSPEIDKMGTSATIGNGRRKVSTPVSLHFALTSPAL